MGQRMEKVLKAHVDAMWARLAEENVKREKVEKERLQQITTLLNNFFNKEMPAVIERGMKKEFSALIPTISQAILPPIQKAISTGIGESFQVQSQSHKFHWFRTFGIIYIASRSSCCSCGHDVCHRQPLWLIVFLVEVPGWRSQIHNKTVSSFHQLD